MKTEDKSRVTQCKKKKFSTQREGDKRKIYSRTHVISVCTPTDLSQRHRCMCPHSNSRRQQSSGTIPASNSSNNSNKVRDPTTRRRRRRHHRQLSLMILKLKTATAPENGNRPDQHLHRHDHRGTLAQQPVREQSRQLLSSDASLLLLTLHIAHRPLPPHAHQTHRARHRVRAATSPAAVGRWRLAPRRGGMELSEAY